MTTNEAVNILKHIKTTTAGYHEIEQALKMYRRSIEVAKRLSCGDERQILIWLIVEYIEEAENVEW
jgi:hypothetical protein